MYVVNRLLKSIYEYPNLAEKLVIRKDPLSYFESHEVGVGVLNRGSTHPISFRAAL